MITTDDLLADFGDCDWWPNGRAARIQAGIPGHDHELVVNIDGCDWEHPIVDLVCQAIVGALPQQWVTDNRGSRLELHPTGRRYNGFTGEDIATLEQALRRIGLEPERAQ